MAYTVHDCRLIVRHALHGGEPEDAAFLQFVNEAGEYLHNCHDWNWAKGKRVTLTLTAGQSEYALPYDFRDSVSILRPDNTFGAIDFVSLEDLHWREQVGTASPGWYVGALLYTEDQYGVPRPRLRLWPSPATGQEVEVLYRAGWTRLAQDEDVVGVPDWMNALYQEFLRAFVLGREEEDLAPLHARLDAITASAVYMNCRRRDGQLQPNLGRHLHGAGEVYGGGWCDRPGWTSDAIYNPPPA